MDFSVMSLNLRVDSWLDFGHRWARRVPSIRELVVTRQPLVLGTQEGLPQMLQQLGDACPGYAFVGSGRLADRPSEHCAIFYRVDGLDVLDWGQFWLSSTPEAVSRSWGSAYPRVCTWARFGERNDPKNGFFVYNTHLDHISHEARRRSAWLIWQGMLRRRLDTGLPAILMGDFNASPKEDTIAFLRGDIHLDDIRTDLVDTAVRMNIQPGRTYHGFRGGKGGHPIDYIFVTPGVSVNSVMVDHLQYGRQYPSDHYPLIATLSLPEQDTDPHRL